MPVLTDRALRDSFAAAARHVGGIWFVVFRGELDLTVERVAHRALLRAEAGGDGPVVLDLSDLRFADLAGMRLLIEAHERLGERLAIVPASRGVMRFLELTGAVARLPFTH